MKPFYTHDCEQCQFLGTVLNDKQNPVDLYVHVNCGTYGPTILARHGNNGPEYTCAPIGAIGLTGCKELEIAAMMVRK